MPLVSDARVLLAMLRCCGSASEPSPGKCALRPMPPLPPTAALRLMEAAAVAASAAADASAAVSSGCRTALP